MEIKGVPFGYFEFSRAIGKKPCPQVRTRAPPPSVTPVPDSGSLPGPVLFELGLMGMGYAEHTRSAIRIRTAPRCQPTAADNWAVAAVETNRCNGSDRTVATVLLGSDQITPPGPL